jgi:serine/threonine-protein kinase RsbW
MHPDGRNSPAGTIPPLSERVVIKIPASTKHVALVRATATSLAALLDFTYDRITDLHIAIDEICSRIMATSAPRARRLEVTFTVEDDSLRIQACGDAPARSDVPFLTTWSRAILDSVTSGVEVTVPEKVACATFSVARG